MYWAALSQQTAVKFSSSVILRWWKREQFARSPNLQFVSKKLLPLFVPVWVGTREPVHRLDGERYCCIDFRIVVAVNSLNSKASIVKFATPAASFWFHHNFCLAFWFIYMYKYVYFFICSFPDCLENFVS